MHQDVLSHFAASKGGILDDSLLEQQDEADAQAARESKVPPSLAPLLLSEELLHLVSASNKLTSDRDIREPSSQNSIALHRSRQCLLLCLTLTCDTPDAQRLATQLRMLIELIRDHTSRSSLVDYGNGLLFLAQACRVLFEIHSAAAICASMDSTGVLELLDNLGRLSHQIFSLAFMRSRTTDQEDDLVGLSEDTTDAILACWQTLVSSTRGAAAVEPTEATVAMWQAVQSGLQRELVEPYIRGRMEAAAIVEEDDLSEQGEETGKDRELYSDQLISIGLLARINSGDTLRFLQQHLGERLAVLDRPPEGEQEAATYWEQVHWLLLIAGHVLADGVTSETPTPPIELASLVNVGEGPLLGHFLEVLGLQALTRLNALPSHAVSPQVAETLLWYTGRWTASYLPFSVAPFVGEAGETALVQVGEMLAHLLGKWTSEAVVVLEIADILRAWQLSETIPAVLIERDALQLIPATVQCMSQLPTNTHSPLLASLVGLNFAYRGAKEFEAERHFASIVGSIRSNFELLAQMPTQTAYTQAQKVLDMLEGLAAAASPRSASAILAFESESFAALNTLASSYRGRTDLVLLVLRIYANLATALDFDFTITAAARQHYYRALWAFFEVLCQDQEALGTAGADRRGGNEGELYEGLRLGFSILPTLATFVETCPPTSAAAGVHTPLEATRVEDLCLLVLLSLTPFVTMETLQVPSVAFAFANGCAEVTRTCAVRLLTLLPSEEGERALWTIAEALGKALNSQEGNVASNALASCKALAEAKMGNRRASGAGGEQQLSFLTSRVTRALLLEPVDTALLEEFAQTARKLVLVLDDAQLLGCVRELAAAGSNTAAEAAQTLFTATKEFESHHSHEGGSQAASVDAQHLQGGGGLAGAASVKAALRVQAQQERVAASQFWKAVRPVVLRARSSIKVR